MRYDGHLPGELPLAADGRLDRRRIARAHREASRAKKERLIARERRERERRAARQAARERRLLAHPFIAWHDGRTYQERPAR